MATKTIKKPKSTKTSKVTYRSIVEMVLWTVFTFGLYSLYWTIKTKGELNNLGADIPTSLFMFIPIVNFFFFYKFAEGYSKYILKSKESSTTLLYFLLFFVLPIISIFILQDGINKIAKK